MLTQKVYPIICPGCPRPLNPAARLQLEIIIKSLLDAGIISKSDSTWAFPVVMVSKPNGEMRFCIDFRKLNDITLDSSYKLPRAEDIFSRLSGKKFFSSMDLKTAFWQLPLAKESRHKTAFPTHMGTFEWNRLPMGAKCSRKSWIGRLRVSAKRK